MKRAPKPNCLFHLGHDLKQPFPQDVLICGDPGRIDLIAAEFDTGGITSNQRGLRIAVGQIDNLDKPEKPLNIAAVCTGIGGESTAIVIEELIHLGVKRIIRIGTCGLLDERLELQDLILSMSAYRGDAASLAYTDDLGLAFPATANYELLKAAEQAAIELKHRHAIGVTAQIAGFYPGNFPAYALSNRQQRIKRQLIDMDCLALSMEEGTLYIIAQLRRVQALSILAATDIAYEDQEQHISGNGIRNGIEVGIRTLLNLHNIRLKKDRS